MKEVLDKLFSEKNIKKTVTVIVILSLIFIAFIITLFSKPSKPEGEVKVPIGGHGEQKETEEKEIKRDYRINEKPINIKETSTELVYILKNRNSKLNNFGESYIYDGYYVFPKRNVKIKKSYDNIINIVFMSSYTPNILGNLGVKSTETEISKTLGVANHSENGVLTYKTNDYYAIFDTNIKEVSVYFKDKLDSEIFWLYYERYEEEKNLKNYMSDLTSRFPSYYRYDYDNKGLELIYTNYGARLYFKQNDKLSAVYLYSDFEDNIKDETEMKKIQEFPNVKILDTNLALSEDILRKTNDLKKEKNILEENIYSNNKIYKYINVLNSYNNIKQDEEKKLDYKKFPKLDKYHIYFEQNDSRYTFNEVSIIKKNKLNYNINTSKVADYLLLTNNYVFYSIKNEGIFRIDVNTGASIELYKGVEEFELKYINNNYLHFDNKQIKAI